MANNYVSRKEFNELVGAVNQLTEAVNQLVGNQTKKSAPKTAKKSEAKPKQTREERLTEQFGDLDTRKKYIDLRNKVASEFKALAEKDGKYIPKKSYKAVLKKATDSCNGKLNKKVVAQIFAESAR
jgi:hypothetical protein